MRNKKRCFCRIGRLVLLAFAGPPPDGMEMCHNDGDSFNDRFDNLRWDTHAANVRDVSRHGRRCGTGPKLDWEEVYAIRTQFASGEHSRRELAREFKVSRPLIYQVLTGRGVYEGGPGPILESPRWLSNQQIVTIRKQRVSGRSLASLAEEHGISESMISLIASGKRHGKVTGPRIRRPYEIICRI